MRVTAQTVRFAEAILGTLRESRAPVTRAALADLATAIWPDSKRATRERRFRESRAWLVRQGTMILSDGRGFRIATTAKEYDDAIRHLERTIKDELVELQWLRRRRPRADGEPEQLVLGEAR